MHRWHRRPSGTMACHRQRPCGCSGQSRQGPPSQASPGGCCSRRLLAKKGRRWWSRQLPRRWWSFRPSGANSRRSLLWQTAERSPTPECVILRTNGNTPQAAGDVYVAGPTCSVVDLCPGTGEGSRASAAVRLPGMKSLRRTGTLCSTLEATSPSPFVPSVEGGRRGERIGCRDNAGLRRRRANRPSSASRPAYTRGASATYELVESCPVDAWPSNSSPVPSRPHVAEGSPTRRPASAIRVGATAARPRNATAEIWSKRC